MTYKTLLLALIAVFLPIQAIILTVLALTTADLVTGVIAAKKRGEKVTSRGLRRTPMKFLAYALGCCCAFLCETYLTGSLIPVLKMLTTIIGLTEMKSIYENLDSISGGQLFKQVIDKLMVTTGDKE